MKELSKLQGQLFPAVNTLFAAMLNHPDFSKIDWSQLKCGCRRRHGRATLGRRTLAEGNRANPIIEA